MELGKGEVAAEALFRLVPARGKELFSLFGEGAAQGGIAHLTIEEFFIAQAGRFGIQREGLCLARVVAVQGPVA